MVHRPDRVDHRDAAALLVPGQHGRRLVAIGRQPDGHRRRVVVGAPLDLTPLDEAVDDHRVRDLEEEDVGHAAPPLREQRSHALGLRDGADDAVEDDAVGRFRLGQFVTDDAENQVVADEVPGLHERTRLQAERRAALDGVAEQVAGRELRESKGLGEEGALGALAGARRAKKQDVHWGAPCVQVNQGVNGKR